MQSNNFSVIKINNVKQINSPCMCGKRGGSQRVNDATINGQKLREAQAGDGNVFRRRSVRPVKHRERDALSD